MTVENWLRGHFHGIGDQIELNTLEVAAVSPLEAQPEAMTGVSLNDRYEDYAGDAEYTRSLRYALSTLYYAMSSSITGGTKSEKRGNRSISIGGHPLTTADREAFRALGDKLRRQLGCDIEDGEGRSCMFDASPMVRRPAKSLRR